MFTLHVGPKSQMLGHRLSSFHPASGVRWVDLFDGCSLQQKNNKSLQQKTFYLTVERNYVHSKKVSNAIVMADFT